LSVTRASSDVAAIVAQGGDHGARLAALLRDGAPPDLAALEHAIASTRSLRGSASLLGLDPFQTYLGRLFQVLEDVVSGELPWSSRVAAALEAAAAAEHRYVEVLECGDTGERELTGLQRAEGVLAACRRSTAVSGAGAEPAPPAAGPAAPELESTRLQIQRLRLCLESQTLAAGAPGLDALQQEIGLLQQALHAPRPPGGASAETVQDGLRNHCEGSLHHLVEAAAREVLEEARERGLRLALRVTGSLDPVDEALGAALLEILANLWSDCLDTHATQGTAEVDTVLRGADRRLVIEVGAAGVGSAEARAAQHHEDDVLGCHPGLRRSRPLVESLHGLVQVQPPEVPGCRFRLSLPLSTERPHVALVRVGRHDIAIPASAVERVLESRDTRAAYDAAGAFVEVEGARIPILHLGFVLGDVAFDEVVREHVVVVGSFERRAALFASDAQRATVGRLIAEQPQGSWVGTLESELGIFPVLHVGALLGRCSPAETVSPAPGGGAVVTSGTNAPAAVLVVDSAVGEREQLQGLLAEAGYGVRALQTASEAWRALEQQPADLLLCDLRLPEMNAQQIAELRRQTGRFGAMPLVLVLAHAGEQTHLVIQQLGAVAWVKSPLQREDVLRTVSRFVVRGSQVST
jgi:CheY-like chemotaxis protein